MGLIVAETKTSIEPVPQGVHSAVCTAIYDLGVQVEEGKFGKKEVHKVNIQWELPEVQIEIDGEMKPRRIGRTFTASLNGKSKLREFLEMWRGKKFTDFELQGFDLDNILGAGCYLQVIHEEREGNVYANIKGVMSLPKGVKLDPPAETLSFALSAETLDDIEHLPEWVQKKVKESLTFAKLEAEQLNAINAQPDFGAADNAFPDMPF